jgi:hypothetical protein
MSIVFKRLRPNEIRKIFYFIIAIIVSVLSFIKIITYILSRIDCFKRNEKIYVQRKYIKRR